VTGVSTELFDGRTVRVHSPSKIEALTDLRLGVSIAKMFSLLDPLPPLEDEAFERAMHCIIVLIGGKRLLIQPDPAEAENWPYMGAIPARIYLAERTHGKLVGHTRGLPGYEMPLLELSPYLHWLSARSFNVSDVRQALNGTR